MENDPSSGTPDAIVYGEDDLPFLELLATLGIVEVRYDLNGEGDSGDCTLEYVCYRDGRQDARLPSIPIGFSDAGEIQLLDEVLERTAADLPESDWVNNDGGYGTVSFFPCAICAEDRVVCDMTYRDGADDYDEDEEFDDLEPPREDEEAGDDAIVEVTFAAVQEGAVQ